MNSILTHSIDIVLAVLCVFFAATAAKKGFVKATLDFIFSILGTVGAWFAANTFCDEVYEMFVRKWFIGLIDEKILSRISDSVDAVIASVPAWITRSAVSIGIIEDTNDVTSALSGNITAQTVEQSFLGPIAVFIVKAVMFIVISVLLGIILRIVSHAIGKAIRHSAAKSTDIALGAILGVFKGLIISLIVSVLLYSVAYMIPDSGFTAYVDASYFCKFAVALLNLM